MSYQVITLFDPFLKGQKRRHILSVRHSGSAAFDIKQGLFDPYNVVTYSTEGPLTIRLSGFTWSDTYFLQRQSLLDIALTVGKGITRGGAYYQTEEYDALMWHELSEDNLDFTQLPLCLPTEITLNPGEAIVINITAYGLNPAGDEIKGSLQWISETLH